MFDGDRKPLQWLRSLGGRRLIGHRNPEAAAGPGRTGDQSRRGLP